MRKNEKTQKKKVDEKVPPVVSQEFFLDGLMLKGCG
jgi:hypothetical protein